MKRWLCSFSLFLVAACGGDDSADTDNPDTPEPDPTAVPRVEETNCRFQVPAEMSSFEFGCGDLIVRENRDNEDSPTIRVHFIRVKGEDTGDATIYLDGGPGGDGNSILAQFATSEALQQAVLSRGDFLSISQRGTGLSEPALPCDQQNPSAAACAANLGSIADLPQYNTGSNADDVDDLRAQLGYDKLNLYGISYGSRLALEVLRRHPEGVRSAVAGGTVPAHVVWPAETPANFYGALGNLTETCNNDAACVEAYGNLSETMVQGIEDLNAEPAQVQVFGQTFPLDGNTYAALVFQLMYSRPVYPLLPLVISDLAEGRVDRVLDPLLDLFLGQGGAGTLSQGMYYSVVCGELFNPAPAASVFEDAIAGLPEPIVEALGQNYAGLQAECQNWPSGRPLPELSDIVTSDVPTLLSNGTIDPITPPRFGEVAKEGLVNAEVVDFVNSGHGSTLQSACGTQVLADFLADPSGALDSTCAAELTIEFELPTAVAPMANIDWAQVKRDIRRAPTPPWIRDRLANWGPR